MALTQYTGCCKAENGLDKGGKGHTGDYLVNSLHGNNDWTLKGMVKYILRHGY